MVTGTVHLTSKDQTARLAEIIKGIQAMQVYVGVPEAETNRKGDGGKEKVTNSQLVYIHTHGVRARSMIKEMQQNISDGYGAAYKLYLISHGSPLWRIPPRPIIEPAIEASDNKTAIAEELGDAARAALDGSRKEAVDHLKKAGMEGQNRVRDWFYDPRNEWPPNKKSTIEGWMSPWGTFFKGKGSDMPLIDTGEMRDSITFVVKDGKE